MTNKNTNLAAAASDNRNTTACKHTPPSGCGRSTLTDRPGQRPRGKHIPLPPELEAPAVDMAAELEAVPKMRGHAQHILSIDCPDCGRTIAYNGACRKCAGRSWLPAGHVDRSVLHRLRKGFDQEVANALAKK
jgi:hypothetical protein